MLDREGPRPASGQYEIHELSKKSNRYLSEHDLVGERIGYVVIIVKVADRLHCQVRVIEARSKS